MISRLRREVFSNGVRYAALAAVVGVLAGGSAWRLASQRREAGSLQAAADQTRAALDVRPESPQFQERMRSTLDAVQRWQAVATDESSRIAELSTAARDSGTTIASFGSVQRTTRGDGEVLCSAQCLVARGTYAQIAQFLEGIHRGRGLAAIDQLTIAQEREGREGVLRASLRVTWYAPANVPAPDARVAGSGP